MKITVKVKTLVAIIVAAATIVEAMVTIKGFQSAESEPIRIIERIESTYPTANSFVYVRQNAHTGSPTSRESTVAENHMYEISSTISCMTSASAQYV